MEDEHNRTKQKQELCKWSSEKKFCAAHGLHFKNIPGCCRPNLNMNLFWSISLKKKKESLQEVFDVSKVMISLKFTHKIKPQKLYLNDIYLLENYKVLHHLVIECKSVVFGNQSMEKKFQTCCYCSGERSSFLSFVHFAV